MPRTVIPRTTATEGLDTSILAGVNLDPSKPLEAGFGTMSTKTAGIEKTVNNFYRILMTDKGSNPVNQTEGTSFFQIFSMPTDNLEALRIFVQMEANDAMAQLFAYQEISGADINERLQAVSVRRVTIATQGLTRLLDVYVLFYFMGGLTVELQLPSVTLT